MNKCIFLAVCTALALLITGALCVRPLAEEPGKPQRSEQPFGLVRRTPWTTSRIRGSPEPPHPYRIERAFPKLSFKNPLLLTRAPGTERLFIAEQAGKI